MVQLEDARSESLQTRKRLAGLVIQTKGYFTKHDSPSCVDFLLPVFCLAFVYSSEISLLRPSVCLLVCLSVCLPVALSVISLV